MWKVSYANFPNPLSRKRSTGPHSLPKGLNGGGSARFANCELRIWLGMLKPQDVLVVLKLIEAPKEERTFSTIASALGISTSEAHAAVRRATKCGLLDPDTRTVRRATLLEFLVHGLRYVFPAQREGITRGILTAHAALPLSAHFAQDDLPPVWPHPKGTSRGEALLPLYKAAPNAALRDPDLYAWLALVDAVRAGRARERNLAVKTITERLAS